MAGVKIPYSFIPLPDEIFTGGLEFSRGEFCILGYLLMNQARFGDVGQPLSDDELINGRKRRDGSRADAGCGLKSHHTIEEARKALEARGWIKTEKVGKDRSKTYRVYRVVIAHLGEVEVEFQHSAKNADQSAKSAEAVGENSQMYMEVEDSNKRKPNARKKRAGEPNPHHTAIVTEVDRLYKAFNRMQPCYWGKGLAFRRLATMLAGQPDWTLEKWLACCQNRFNSEVNKAEAPEFWLHKLPNYAAGPLNKFGHPLQENNGKNTVSKGTREEHDDAVAETVLRDFRAAQAQRNDARREEGGSLDTDAANGSPGV